MGTIVPRLTAAEARDLATLERAIGRGIKMFHKVGRALAEIQQRRLYRATHATFESYCTARWGFGRAHGYRLIDAAEVAENLSPRGDIPLPAPASEKQLRPLIGLTPDDQRAAWADATAGAGGQQPTAAQVAQAAARVLDGLDTAEKVRTLERNGAARRAAVTRDNEAEAIAQGLRLLKRARRVFGQALPRTEGVIEAIEEAERRARAA